jgi:hypothetical protein
MTTWHITIDQFGYRPGDEKVAVIVDPQEGFNKNDRFTPGRVYQVRKSADGEVVFTGAPVVWNDGQTDPLSGDKAWWFDFSLLTEPGAYYIYDVENNRMSYEFRIGDDVYERVLYHALRVYYYQREGLKHEAPYAEYPWFDEAAWIGPGQDREARDVFAPDDDTRVRDVSGGWMDAGDTNKYVTFMDSCIHELLAAYESNPAFFKNFCLNIPESHLDAPDILSEIKWEMDWLIKMQNDDGSAHIKCGMQRANASSPPSKDATPRVYHGMKSSAAAIALAGVFAHGARVYGTIPVYSEYGEMLYKKAEKSWEWYMDCVKNGTRNENIDQGEICSGWANRPIAIQDMMAVASAVSLYALTGNEKYHDYIKNNYKSVPPMTANMDNFHESGFINFPRQLGMGYVLYMSLPSADPAVVKDIQDKWVELARNTETFLPHQFVPEKNAYRAYIAKEIINWGHLQNRGVRGYDAYMLSEMNLIPELSHNLKENAANQLHHLHGVNPFNMTYLTNMYAAGASKSVKYMYHEWFMDVPGFGMAAPPGYLVGGPNTWSYERPPMTFTEMLEKRKKGEPLEKKWPGRTGPYADLSHFKLPSRLSPPDGQPPFKSYLDAPHFYGKVSEVYKGFMSYAWTEPMCAYQSTYVRLLACFVGKESLPPVLLST